MGVSSLLADGTMSTRSGTPPVTKSRRASFLKFLQDHPNVQEKRSQRLADGTTQTTVRRGVPTSSTTTTRTTTTTTTSASSSSLPSSSVNPLDSNTTFSPLEYDLNTATRLFEEMDTNHDGRITWDEFLSYLNQSEGRTPPTQRVSRRSSLGMGLNATTKVQRRLALRKFFNRLDVDMNGSVSQEELREGVMNDPNIQRMFDATALRHIHGQ
jgi:hypothetical protein